MSNKRKEHGNVKKFYCLGCGDRIAKIVSERTGGMCRPCEYDHDMNELDYIPDRLHAVVELATI